MNVQLKKPLGRAGNTELLVLLLCVKVVLVGSKRCWFGSDMHVSASASCSHSHPQHFYSRQHPPAGRFLQASQCTLSLLLPWVLLLHPICPHLISLQRGLCRMVGKAHRYAALPFPRGLGAWITCVGNAAAMIWPPSVSCRQFWGLAFMLQGEMLLDYFPAPLELCCPCFTWGK